MSSVIRKKWYFSVSTRSLGVVSASSPSAGQSQGGIKPDGSRFLHVGKKYPYDHKHRHVTDDGVLYEFDTAYQLVSDFYAEVDRVLKEVSR